MTLYFDLPILDFIQTYFRTSLFDKIMPVITALGELGIFWILLAVLFLLDKEKRNMALVMGGAMLLGLLVGNLFLKNVIHRARPFDVNTAVELLIAKPTDYSMPSGHALSSFAAATVLFHYNKKYGVFALVLATLIAWSRLYLYVHYPSDVLVGAALGVALAWAAIWIDRGVQHLWKKHMEKAESEPESSEKK